jgi:hypothetical protein
MVAVSPADAPWLWVVGTAASASEAAILVPTDPTCARPRDGSTRINPEIISAPAIAPLLVVILMFPHIEMLPAVSLYIKLAYEASAA